MYARVTTFPGLAPERVKATLEEFREQHLPLLEQQPGYRGMWAGVDFAGGRAIAVTYWESMEDLRATDKLAGRRAGGRGLGLRARPQPPAGHRPLRDGHPEAARSRLKPASAARTRCAPLGGAVCAGVSRPARRCARRSGASRTGARARAGAGRCGATPGSDDGRSRPPRSGRRHRAAVRPPRSGHSRPSSTCRRSAARSHPSSGRIGSNFSALNARSGAAAAERRSSRSCRSRVAPHSSPTIRRSGWRSSRARSTDGTVVTSSNRSPPAARATQRSWAAR